MGEQAFEAGAHAAQPTSQALLQAVLDSATSGIVVVAAVRDHAGRIVDFRFELANPRGVELLGLPAATLVGGSMVGLFPGAEASGLFGMYVAVTETGVPAEQEAHYADDRVGFWLNVSAVKVGDGAAITFTDITNRKHAERELREQKAFAEQVIENDTTGICYLDRDLYYRMANPVLCDFLQLPHDRIVGHHISEVVPGGVDTILPLLRRVLDAGETVRFQALPLAYTLPDGSTRQTYWDASYLPMTRAGAEGVEGVLVLASEVSDRVAVERMQAERLEALQAVAGQRAFAERVLANVLGGVAYLDQALVFRFANPPYARFLGYTPAQIVGSYLDDVAPGAVEQTGPWLQEVMDTGTPFEQTNFNLVIREPDGRVRNTYWDFVYYPDEPDATGRAKGVFVLANEISERLRAERERDEAQRARIRLLEEANVHKEQFLSILSHELRTPINAIMGFGSILDDEVLGPLSEPQHDATRKILAGSERMLALITDLLDMSRIQAGMFSVAVRDVDLTAVAMDAIAALKPLAARKGLALRVEAEGEAPRVRADAQRLDQVVVNLLSNAIKFTPEGGRVVVRVRGEGAGVRVEVEDSGIGIAAEHHDRIFEAFTQVDMSNTRQAGGTGLGLAIARSLVEAHGGAIGVASEPGAGSTFWFTLPPEGPAAG